MVPHEEVQREGLGIDAILLAMGFILGCVACFFRRRGVGNLEGCVARFHPRKGLWGGGGCCVSLGSV